MQIFYGNLFLIYIVLIFNKILLSILCKKIILYSIETLNNGIEYREKEEVSCYEFKIKNHNLLKIFSSIHLLENRYLKCKLRTEEVKYFIPNAVEISQSTSILLNLSSIEDDQEKELSHNFFLGQISHGFLQRFRLYVTLGDSYVTIICFYEFINILRILEILGLKRTKNNNLFLKYLLINSIMNVNFDFKSLNIFLYIKKTSFKLSDWILEYLFSIFTRFLFSGKNTNNIFLLFKSMESIYEHKVVLSYSAYKYMKEKFFKENIFIISNNTVICLKKILKLSSGIDCICFFLQHSKIDLFHFSLSYKELNQNIIALLSKIKLEKLKNLTLVDRSDEKIILNLFINYGYFHISEYVKIISNLNIEEINIILKYCENIKRLVIVSDEAYYNILFVLYTFALTHKNIFIKYKCMNFVMECYQNDLLTNIPVNFFFIIGKYNISLKNCDSCYKNSLNLFRRIMIKLQKNKCLEGCKLIYYKASIVKDIFITTIKDDLQLKLHCRLIEYIADLPSLESIFFENILFSKKLIRFILESNQLMSIKLKNVKIRSELFSRFKIYNYVLRGLTIKKSNFNFDINFLRFLSMFKNISFLKIYIQYIDSKLRKKIPKLLSKKTDNKGLQIVPCLDYLKITMSKRIIGEFPILFSLSKILDFKKLRMLALELYDFSVDDLQVISNLTNLTNILIRLYRNSIEINLEKLCIFIKNNKIKKIWLVIFDLNKKIIEFLHSLKDIQFNLSVGFSSVEISDFESPKTIEYINSSVVVFFCTNSHFVFPEKLNYFKEKGIIV